MSRYSGATGESLKSEEDILRQVEQSLARKVGRMLRRGKGISLYRLNQIFSPTALSTWKTGEGGLKRSLTLAAQTKTRRQLFSYSGAQGSLLSLPLSLCVCMCMCMHVHVNVMCVCVCVCMFMSMLCAVCVCMCMHVHVNVMCGVCVYVYACSCQCYMCGVCVCVCVCVNMLVV